MITTLPTLIENKIASYFVAAAETILLKRTKLKVREIEKKISAGLCPTKCSRLTLKLMPERGPIKAM
jgi:hypothetical protein